MSSSATALALGGLSASVTPRGRVRLQESSEAIDAETAARVRAAFGRGEALGLLHLGAAEHGELPASIAWWRDVARLFVAGMRSIPDLDEAREVDVPFPRGELDRMLAGVPPMEGAEYLGLAALEDAWSALSIAARLELREFDGRAEEWLRSKHESWSMVGRVVFHLAENKAGAEDEPFAFLSTYTHRLSSAKKRGDAQPHHLPLKHALEEYAGAKDRAALVALLAPVSRAAESSALVRELVESGDLYHPLAWTPADAHRFLKEVPAIEAAGVKVRVGDFWSADARGPVLSLKIGDRAASNLGGDSLCDFRAELAFEGEPITPTEIRRILSKSDGLALLRGKWIEVDRARLEAVLERFEQAEAREDEIGLAEAMRLLAGAAIDGNALGAAPEWSEVVAGEWLASVLEGMRGPEGVSGIEAPRALRGTLRPYQLAGMKWLWFVGKLGLGACLADDMGLGKTIQVLSLLLALKHRQEAQGPHLLVVPATLLANWQAEAARFAPTLEVVFAHPSFGPQAAAAQTAAESADLVVTTYGYLRRTSWLSERAWDLVILDEAQAIKNPASQQTRAVKKLAAKRRAALTGTPVENRLGDLWSIFDFLNPGLLGSAQKFRDFCKRLGDDYTPLRKLVGPYVLRRLKSDKRIAPDLPEKTEMIAWCGLSRAQTVHYQKSVAELARALEAARNGDALMRRGLVLAYLTRLKQICNHPSQWLRDGSWDPAESGKHARLTEIAETIAARQEKAIVFTQFQEMTAPIASWMRELLGGEGLVLHGGVAVKRRRELVERFQEDEDARFMVVTVKTGGAGINLTAASHVIHFDRWWNPAVENQATDRAYRIGQTRNVLVHKLVTRGTVEEKIDAMLASKRAMADGVLGAEGERALTELSDEELISLVSLDVTRAFDEDTRRTAGGAR